MGDANELAHELMLAHPYDSNNGFNKMLTVLWIGIFLIWLPDVNNMRPDVISWIGTYIMIFSLYRMRTISKSFRKAFYASYGLGLLMPILSWHRHSRIRFCRLGLRIRKHDCLPGIVSYDEWQIIWMPQ